MKTEDLKKAPSRSVTRISSSGSGTTSFFFLMGCSDSSTGVTAEDPIIKIPAAQWVFVSDSVMDSIQNLSDHRGESALKKV